VSCKLVGREPERTALTGLLDGARSGRSGALVVRGDGGLGKTALLESAIASASDMTVVSAAGVESEAGLAFAALHQLCAPLLDRLDRLPGPQRDALAVTFGLTSGDVPDLLLVGLATLGLLTAAAEDRPLLCVLDAAQWLDPASAQTLAFVAKRLSGQRAVVVFAAREPRDELRTLPAVVLEGLGEGDALDLLRSALSERIDALVAEQIAAEARGHPPTLMQLARNLSPARLAGGFGLPDALSAADELAQASVGWIEELREDERWLLLLAAAEPTGKPHLILPAASRMGIPHAALESVERVGRLQAGARLQFRHALERAVVYRAASGQERRRVHRALAESYDAEIDADWRAWHLAEATVDPAEDVAGELERQAEHARSRAGIGTAAAFLERATALTPDPVRRAQRAGAAACGRRLPRDRMSSANARHSHSLKGGTK
jgi:AAA ATPase domain